MKIYLDPSLDILYASFYILGLKQVFGNDNVRYSSKYFKQFVHDNHFFAFVVYSDKFEKRVIIDFTDSKVIDELALDWSDVYGKINYCSTHLNFNKVVPIGPSFGIKLHNSLKTLALSISNLLKAYRRIPNKKKFLSDYKAQYFRLPYNYYGPESSNSNYIFFIASLWKQESKTNTYRANFIKSCKSLKTIKFEGGFAPRTKNDIEGFKNETIKARIDLSTYLAKIKRTEIVFNTPAVKDCHGWKLAEFLCLGKAILSTELLRELPKPLLDSEHLVITDGSQEDNFNKTNLILENKNLKEMLEHNARAYFNTYLAPDIVIIRLLNHISFNHTI